MRMIIITKQVMREHHPLENQKITVDDRAIEDRSTSQTELRMDALSRGAQLFIWSLRYWLVAVRLKQSPALALRDAYVAAGCAEGEILIDEVMSLIGVASKRPVEIRYCCKITLSEDEMLLLSCLRLLQAGEVDRAATALNALMVPALSRSVCRIADQYRGLLMNAGLSLTAPRQFKVVT